MIESFQKQTRIKSLPAFNILRKARLKETDLNEVVRTVAGVLPEYMHADTVAEVALSEKDLTIMADIALLREALINLMKNAMDAMPNGGVFSLITSRIEFGVEFSLDGLNFIAGPCASISLADTGIRIDEKTKERVFEPLCAPKTGDGRGLGLPMAYHIIREHRGSIIVESTPGQGTAINVYLPLAKPETMNMIPIPLPAHHGRNCLSHSI